MEIKFTWQTIWPIWYSKGKIKQDKNSSKMEHKNDQKFKCKMKTTNTIKSCVIFWAAPFISLQNWEDADTVGSETVVPCFVTWNCTDIQNIQNTTLFSKEKKDTLTK